MLSHGSKLGREFDQGRVSTQGEHGGLELLVQP
jgi:hypothetical protein